MSIALVECPHCDGIEKTKSAWERKHKRCTRFIEKHRKFERAVRVEPPTKDQIKARMQAVVVREMKGSRTAIELRRDRGTVVFIPMALGAFDIGSDDSEKFDESYEPIFDYPPSRAATLYIQNAMQVGGTPKFVKEISSLINVECDQKERVAAKLVCNHERAEKLAKKAAIAARKIAAAEKKAEREKKAAEKKDKKTDESKTTKKKTKKVIGKKDKKATKKKTKTVAKKKTKKKTSKGPRKTTKKIMVRR